MNLSPDKRYLQKIVELENLFFVIFLATIACIRLFLFTWPISSPVVLDFHFHHYIYGVLIIIMALCFDNLHARTIIFAIGLGFFADEVPLFFIHPWNWTVYDAARTRFELLLVIAGVFAFRESLLLRIKSYKQKNA